MAATDKSNPGNSIRTQICTKFLMFNLHCPSYVSSIRNTLLALHPTPISISVSIVSQLIAVHHDPLLLESTISRALKEAGFEIYSVIRDPTPPTAAVDDSVVETNYDSGDGWFKKVVKGWVPNRGPRKQLGDINTLTTCDLCWAEGGEKANAKEISSCSSSFSY